MLDLPEVTDLAGNVARTLFPGRRVENISVEPRIGAFGHDLLWVTLLIQSDKPGWPDGEAIIAFMGELGDRLLELGDERQPIVHMLTPEELAADAESGC